MNSLRAVIRNLSRKKNAKYIEVQPMPDFMNEGMDNAREGILYLFGNMSVRPNVFQVAIEGGMDIGGNFMSDAGSQISDSVMVPGSTFLEGSGTLFIPENGEQRTLLEKVKKYLRDIANSVIETFTDADQLTGMFFGALRNLINVLASNFLEAAAPFISGGLDIASGLVNTFDAARRKFNTWRRGREVDVLTGHPTTVVNSIKGAMTRSLFEGLYQTLKGAASLAVDVLAAGASTLVNVLVAVAETVIKLVWRLVETAKMTKFFGEAKQHRAESFHRDGREFNKWYKSYALEIPALSVLTLNSGICGDKMRYLAMFKDDDSVITQAQFDQGCGYLEGLKGEGSRYLGNAGFKFSSSDELVQSLLNRADQFADVDDNAVIGGLQTVLG